MVGHVLLVEHALDGRGQLLDDDLPGRLARCDHLVAAGMLRPGLVQVVGVERLVDDAGVGSVLPGAHQCRGDVARPRPHSQPDAVGHGACRAATSSRTRSTYNDCSRSTIGARCAVPMGRPSTVWTGTTPANVPVTNASSAL